MHITTRGRDRVPRIDRDQPRTVAAARLQHESKGVVGRRAEVTAPEDDEVRMREVFGVESSRRTLRPEDVAGLTADAPRLTRRAERVKYPS